MFYAPFVPYIFYMFYVPFHIQSIWAYFITTYHNEIIAVWVVKTWSKGNDEWSIVSNKELQELDSWSLFDAN